jgi:hypothetical protein
MADILVNLPLIIHQELHFMIDGISAHFSIVALPQVSGSKASWLVDR